MEKTPISMRKNIIIFGKTNSGKSRLFNALLKQAVSIVAEISGTTTDPVIKPMELVGYGPITLIDTAGIDDDTILGAQRLQKTKEALNRADLVIWVTPVNEEGESKIDLGKVPVIKVYTMCDIAEPNVVAEAKRRNPQGVFISSYSNEEIKELENILVFELQKQIRDDETMLGGIIEKNSTIVMVIPLDDSAPKGRLILPQVQAIRDCLDNEIRVVAVKPDMLAETLDDLTKVDLVITDSQVFDEVGAIVPKSIPLTSFSMLLANQKGRIGQLIEGTKAIDKLNDNDDILMLEACTHSTTHDDIGKVKIPALLQKTTGRKLNFTHLSGYDFPENIEKYKLVIQCGGCMINKKTIQNRMEILAKKRVPVTNYGVVLAYLNGILDRASEIFMK